MKFAKWAYRIAGIYGLLVLAPLLFLEHAVSQNYPPTITHPEYYYGFAITGVAWHVAFIVIGNDPQRFRLLMPVTWLEKSYGLIAIVLYVQGRISSQVLALGLIDLLFAALFVCAYVATRHHTKDNPELPNPSSPRLNWNPLTQSGWTARFFQEIFAKDKMEFQRSLIILISKTIHQRSLI